MTILAPPPVLTASTRTWSTPETLWRAMWVLLACDVLVLGLLLYAGQVHYAALSAIGVDSAPSIVASQKIKSALAAMDADAANELLSGGASPPASLQSFGAHRQEAATAIVAAAKNITYGDAEQVPILHIQLGLGGYETLIQRARDLREQPNPSFVGVYEQAAHLLDSNILTAADALDQANLEHLDGAYSGQHSTSLFSRTSLGAAVLLFLVLLAALQLFLFQRTRRLINIPLFAASLLLLVFALYSLSALSAVESNLKLAKEDAFTSIHALWRARAVAHAARADESRFLLDPQHAGEHTAAFFAKRDRLARRSASGFTGYLADELSNITFPGEREAANETLDAFDRYVAVDARIRDLEHHGQHAAALALCAGLAPGQSNWAFEQFDSALGRTLKINQDAFDTSVASGLAALRNWQVKTAIFAALMAILCSLGLLQRLRDYR